jgi:hypothetical protein
MGARAAFTLWLRAAKVGLHAPSLRLRLAPGSASATLCPARPLGCRLQPMLLAEIEKAGFERPALRQQARPDGARWTIEVIKDRCELRAEVSDLAQQLARPLPARPSASQLRKSSATREHPFGCHLARDRRHSVTATPSVRAGYKHNHTGVQACGGTFQRWSENRQSVT